MLEIFFIAFVYTHQISYKRGVLMKIGTMKKKKKKIARLAYMICKF